ncbi:MAG: zinc-binding dehydrogenase [Lentisphaerae bacterium]|jgi:threonine dehydrogenase-like Zn-dependent dehydrogenase|nr:zinc-binding dehydrogenase [Lentisphaerota bacterium]MBT4814547.1 zinc-binding dehydrogenase [Lentisphaerota bacterium]MBT5608537.1 zinc-binding dehydrogenase [Lentisphaerota bacterium]MBT7060250.1 zinc-binding dehydrogenase [Lentisphaerota bacterium]MBT7843254.1 zinc-binding dehydrogenase [Lentisphaerota bacterium]
MKAAITDGKGKVWLGDVPTPEPNDYQCLCRHLACASCTGTDLKHINDKLPWAQNYPGLLGHESIGEVISVGKKVTKFKKGDWVLRPAAAYPGETHAGYTSMWGGFAEYGLVTDVPALLADEPDATPNNYTRFQLAVPKELGISPADATTLITLKETASYVASIGVGLYSSVLVLGSGSVGISMLIFTKIFGAYPAIMVGRRDEPLAYAKERIGADATINCSDTDVIAAVRELTDGKGVDRIIDTTGSAEFLNDCLPCLTEEGKAAAYATYDRTKTVGATVDQDRLITGRTGEDDAHQYLLDAVKLGLLDLSAFYSHKMPFEKISEGFDMLARKEAFKVVFEMGD